MIALALPQAAEPIARTSLWVVVGYLGLLLALGVLSRRFFRGTAGDFFVASRSIGPFMLLMSVFGTTMTAFALVGSTSKAFTHGIGVYGLMASTSGIVHSIIFFLIGIRLWAIGKRHGFVTQIQFFRARFQSEFLGLLLFPILVGLVIPYLLVGLLGAGAVIRGVTRGMFPGTFEGGAVPPWLTGLVICGVVLFYVFLGGVRSTAWANTFQTIVFMIMGVVAFFMIAQRLGGAPAATQLALEKAPLHLGREGLIGKAEFLTYLFVPLSVGMFPHLFQHWLTARSARAFRLTTVAHPLCIAIVWAPCILIGIWAAGLELQPPNANANAVLGMMVRRLDSSFIEGLLTAGILAAIMSSLDSQFVSLGSMFTNDVVLRFAGKERFSDRQQVLIGRGFIVAVVGLTYWLSLHPPPNVFDLGVWCFSGFAALFPLVFAAVYWRRATRAGAIATVLVTVVTWSWFFWQGLVRPVRAGAQAESEEEFLVSGMTVATVLVAVSALTMVLVSLATRPPAPAVVDRFVIPRKSLP